MNLLFDLFTEILPDIVKSVPVITTTIATKDTGKKNQI
jgi:hypothetical protein